jgi:hypothetical protein
MSSVSGVIGAQWRDGGHIVLTQMFDPSLAAHKTGQTNASPLMPRPMTSPRVDTVLLDGERERDEGDPAEFLSSDSSGKNTTGANVEGDVTEAKRCIVSGGGSVFAGLAEEEEECQAEHVDDGKGFHRSFSTSKSSEMVNGRYRNRLDMIRRWISTGITTKLSAES